jgi:hypothetical protein
MRIELLYFDGCPGYQRFLPRLRELVAQAGIREQVELRRVDGADLESGARERYDFGLKCRLYRTSEGLRGTPPDEWVVRALDATRRTADGDADLA